MAVIQKLEVCKFNSILLTSEFFDSYVINYKYSEQCKFFQDNLWNIFAFLECSYKTGLLEGLINLEMLCWCYFTCLGTEEQGRQKREEKEQQQSPENKTNNNIKWKLSFRKT